MKALQPLGTIPTRHPASFPPAAFTAKLDDARAADRIKKAHETLYHFHEPADEAEANLWLRRYLVNYNNGRHRSEDHARIEDWLKHLPPPPACGRCAPGSGSAPSPGSPDATMTGTSSGRSAGRDDPRRASRRQPNSCWDVRP